MARLPLFPLGSPLLPGGRMSLRLFEPRYLEMLQDLTTAPPAAPSAPHQPRSFGVIAIRRGHEVGPDAATEIFEIGCEARLLNSETVPDQGRPMVVIGIAGGDRFRLLHRDDHTHPYAVAEVEWLDDLSRDDDVELAGAAGALRREHAAYLRRNGSQPMTLTGPVEELAYRAAELTVLTQVDLQSVLRIDSALGRIERMRALLRREQTLSERVASVPFVPGPGDISLN